MKKENVIILGASDKPDRYSYKALVMLKEFGHNPIGVHPSLTEVEGSKVFKDLNEAKGKMPNVDTITVYVNPEISTKIVQDLVNTKAKRVIFNPGSENPGIYEELKKHGIESEEACTLVLLRTGQY